MKIAMGKDWEIGQQSQETIVIGRTLTLRSAITFIVKPKELFFFREEQTKLQRIRYGEV